MKLIFCLLLLIGTAYSLDSSADQDMSICEANPSAPLCAQAQAKIPDSLPERYALTSLIDNAERSIRRHYGYSIAQKSCGFVNSAHVAYHCKMIATSGHACEVNLLQIWERADLQIACEKKRGYRVMLNPGPVPPTMD